MRTIYKYEIKITDYQTIPLPPNAEILTVQCQRGKPYIWVKTNPDWSCISRKLRLAGTGHAIEEDNLKYIGTFLVESDSLVFHLFEE